MDELSCGLSDNIVSDDMVSTSLEFPIVMQSIQLQ